MRKSLRVAVLAVGALTALSLGSVTWAYASTSDYRFDAASVPQAPVALVFGAGLTRDNRPTGLLAGRLDIAEELYRTGRVRVLLLSGEGAGDYDEPAAMRRYLLDHGVPARAIVEDRAGLDTWDSCTRAHRVYGVDRAVVVTQSFHLPRAVALCRAAGIEAFGVGHDSWSTSAGVTAYGYVREAFADGKAIWEGLVTKRDPRVLGQAESGVTDALRG
ncbi:SanA/YdcF family protein [Solihabitans fulvus]|uniref:SanA/YdcF family protein n=1 Tax=Solihabitans fulvus TaxID=1892852 RepID=UPI001CB7609D|nr:ElyC/SanA/YdcF family protein [Solihabitans fulvus]